MIEPNAAKDLVSHWATALGIEGFNCFNCLRSRGALDSRSPGRGCCPIPIWPLVGAGNSALEAAIALVARTEGAEIEFRAADEINEVTLVVRDGFTNDIKFANKQKLYHCIDEGKIRVCWDSEVKEILESEVVLMNRFTQQEMTVENDYVLALIRGERPTKFLKSIGITIPES